MPGGGAVFQTLRLTLAPGPEESRHEFSMFTPAAPGSASGFCDIAMAGNDIRPGRLGR